MSCAIDTTFLQNNQVRNREIGAYVSLRYCVMNVVNRTGDHSMNEYFNLLQLSIDCLRDLRLYEEQSLEVAYLIPNEAGIIEFPPDMVSWTKIGIPINGQLYNLTVNNTMLLNRAQTCGVDIRTMYTGNSVSLNGGYLYGDHFRGNRFVSGLYGIGGGFNTAYYRVDEKMRQIQFDGIIPNSEIVLEYSSSGIGPGTIVSPQCIPVIREYDLWQRIENDPRVAVSQKEMKKSRYDQEVEKLHMYNNMFSLQEYLDYSYQGTRNGIKR